ncbi:hypothetical protein F2P81_004027 [Scophthalmus maximus]|uniref:Uncharacterized protein n=1 Tax=Scophthalmus maximus TaxID=52904 RepID=A0A6A4TG04_SCOMX|nr:hypothetical protein F2P81_004027 [Scophthalmus maximus]
MSPASRSARQNIPIAVAHRASDRLGSERLSCLRLVKPGINQRRAERRCQAPGDVIAVRHESETRKALFPL